MPKGKKKGKYDHKRTEANFSSDEDAGIDMTNDNCSETSAQSDLKSNHDEAENEIQEKLEDKLLETIEALNARSNAARATALVALRAVLQRRNVTHLLGNHRATLADHVARMLRRGKEGERRAAAAVATILALQIGDEGADEFVREVRPALVATCTDKGASLDTRAECCSALTALCYLFEDDLTEILEVMRVYETIFSGSYLKGDGSVKVSSAVVEEGAYHCAALDGWSLLLTLLPPSHAAAVLRQHAPGVARLAELLQAASCEVRMAAGGAIAIVHELILDEDILPLPEQLAPRLTELARDSHKYRAKRERKMQRATFRDILKYIEDDIVPSLTIRVGAESVTMDTWGGRAAYECLTATLGAGLQTLVPQCAVLRDALGMGDALALNMPRTKLNKRTRHLQNNAATKARQLVRSKNRDKRSAALSAM